MKQSQLLGGIGWHLGLLGCAALLGFWTLTAPKATTKGPSQARVWSARASDLQRIELAAKDGKHVILEPKEDASGRFFVGTVTQPPPPTPAPVPAQADAGAAPAAPIPPAVTNKDAPKPQRFVSVKEGQTVASGLTDLEAARTLGKVDAGRYSLFGLDGEGQGLLTVVLGGNSRKLRLGEKAPGGRDRYVLDEGSLEAFAVSDSLISSLLSAERRLLEPEFHDFGERKVARVVIVARGKQREALPVEGNQEFWANPAEPATKDETLSNWMSKLKRLRISTFIEDLSPSADDAVVRVDYTDDKGNKLGFLELVRRSAGEEDDHEGPAEGESSGRARYAARSERSRWYAAVPRNTGEQLEQDLATILEH